MFFFILKVNGISLIMSPLVCFKILSISCSVSPYSLSVPVFILHYFFTFRVNGVAFSDRVPSSGVTSDCDVCCPSDYEFGCSFFYSLVFNVGPYSKVHGSDSVKKDYLGAYQLFRDTLQERVWIPLPDILLLLCVYWNLKLARFASTNEVFPLYILQDRFSFSP